MNTDGVFTGPTYKIGETNYYNVGDALAAINSSFSTSLGDALLWDATAGKFSAKHGTNGDASVITDVADGEISDSSSDAVNGSQLHGVSSYVVDALGVVPKSMQTAPSPHRLTPLRTPSTTTSVTPRMRLMITPCCGMRLPMAVLEPTMPAMTVKPASSLMSLMAVLVRTVPMQ